MGAQILALGLAVQVLSIVRWTSGNTVVRLRMTRGPVAATRLSPEIQTGTARLGTPEILKPSAQNATAKLVTAADVMLEFYQHMCNWSKDGLNPHEARTLPGHR
eukprot:6479587-Amphidinium_carterae.2